jgi:cell division protein FtsL
MFAQLPLMQEAAQNHLIDRIMPGDMLPVIVVSLALLTGMVIAIVSIVVGTWRKVRERQVAASLIQDMLDRNLSPQEIQQLIGMWAQASGGKVDIPRSLSAIEMPHLPPKPPKPVKPLA